ncbi:hypothetical protein [Lacihabitans soyangensis]|uniref:Uncharacterized protein n=1 Tax=Lacihabitans soyangensis TaxID=869394 RepID=A0AAE3H0L3_9BACT|nr:hypothetical protein [Lacihabitans soyangensis]MCP9762769.1 hypothetical protein [Lacihabitans soyangensis]
MTRILTIFFCVCIYVCSFAKEPLQNEDFTSEFKKLNQLESIIMANPNFTVDSVIKEQPQLLKDLGINSETKSNIGDDDPMKPAGFPAFWWGFCLGIWGILIVYLITDNNKAALNKTVKGCITATAIGLGVYVIAIVGSLIAAAATSPY